MFTSITTNYSTSKGVNRLSSMERKLILIPDDIKNILVGILLGDAHIVKRSTTGNSKLVYAQTAVKHKMYFDCVYSKFFRFYVKDYRPQSRITKDKKTNKIYSAISFTTMQLPYFNAYKELFYSSNKKLVPNNIHELLTPQGLAYWIMDDGSKQGKGLHISVYAFTNDDVDKLMFTLQDKFNLKCSIHYNKNNKPRIYIFKESMSHLTDMIKPYFVSDMLYKLGL